MMLHKNGNPRCSICNEDFFITLFSCTLPDVIHLLHTLHLADCFELLGNAFLGLRKANTERLSQEKASLYLNTLWRE